MAPFDRFIKMSEELCCIPAFNLLGTGYANTYYDTVLSMTGAGALDRLLTCYAGLPMCCQLHRDDAIRADLLSHHEFGPIARNIMKLWYIAVWFKLPQGQQSPDVPPQFVPTAYAYPETLLGPAVGAHPAGAKPTGHQAWTSPPKNLPLADPAAPEKCRRAASKIHLTRPSVKRSQDPH
jgi:hypothetical protein